MTARQRIVGLLAVSFFIQAGTFMSLYRLGMERHIGQPGSYPRLAFLLDHTWALWTMGSALSLVLCTAIAFLCLGENVAGHWMDAGFEGARATLLAGIIAPPAAVWLSLNLWGS